jgi:hypothetical protein
MRKRIIRALIFAAVAIGASVGIAGAAGAIEWPGAHTPQSTYGSNWD